jgi:hypothetical protein
MKRNLDRLPPDLMSQRREEETDVSRSQIGISSVPPQQVDVAPPARVELAANGLGISGRTPRIVVRRHASPRRKRAKQDEIGSQASVEPGDQRCDQDRGLLQ